MALKRTSGESTRIELADGDWVEVRTDISKRSMNRLMSYFPSRSQEDIKENGITTEEGLEFQTGLFEVLVTAWSVDDSPSVGTYLELEAGDGVAELDEKLANHFEALMPSKEEQGKQ